MNNAFDDTEAMKYIRTLRDGLKRGFAVAYLEWIRAGRKGGMPSRGRLAPSLAKAVSLNLDSLN